MLTYKQLNDKGNQNQNIFKTFILDKITRNKITIKTEQELAIYKEISFFLNPPIKKI